MKEKDTDIQLVAFGMIAELLGGQEKQWPLTRDTDQLKAELIAAFPELKDLPFVVAVNMEVVQNNQPIAPGAQVALLPPYSGG